MQKKLFTKELGATTATIFHLTDAWKGSGGVVIGFMVWICEVIIEST